MLAAAARAARARAAHRALTLAPPSTSASASLSTSSQAEESSKAPPSATSHLPDYVPPEPGGSYAAVVPRNGIDLLHDPFWNKGTAFSLVERDRLKLRGLLPPRHSASIEGQARRIMDDVESGQLFDDPAAMGPDAGVDAEDVRRWKLLDNLATRNTTLFYKVLLSDFNRFQRVVYTPV